MVSLTALSARDTDIADMRRDPSVLTGTRSKLFVTSTLPQRFLPGAPLKATPASQGASWCL